MAFDLKRLLEVLLYSSSDPVSVKEVQRVVGRYHEEAAGRSSDGDAVPGDAEAGEGEATPDEVPTLLTGSTIREAFAQVREELNESGSVLELAEGPHGFRLVVRPAHADWVRLFRKEPRPARLGRAALETLAIVAYRQPVTRGEMEKIRGVAVDSALQKLTELELVASVGRAELPGRPTQFGTTEKFLEFCGLRSIEDLPSSDVLSPARLDAWLEEEEEGEAMAGNREMGLPVDEEAVST